MTRRSWWLATAAVLALAMVSAPAAYADAGDGSGACHSDKRTQSQATVSTFFASPGAYVRWDRDESPPADTAPWAVQMTVTPAGAFAGFCLNGFNDQPPPTMGPSYWFRSDRPAPASGGSPRLVIEFLGSTQANPDDINLRPLFWTSGWQQEGVGATASDWDSVGGINPAGCRHYEMTYQEALGCHPGEIVQDVFFVTDSIWLITGGYTNWIDELQYGSAFLTAPGSAGNSNNGGS